MDQLLIALDVDSATRALELADQLRGAAGGFKIGSRLFTAAGPTIVERLVERGDRVFLDLKFHDIPTIVAGAVTAAMNLGAWMLTVHASGGRDMMHAARTAAADAAAARGIAEPLIVAVTVLTSLDANRLRELGVDRDVADQAEHLASMAQQAGLHGAVASPHEIDSVRRRCGQQFIIVTPGIRGGSPAHADNAARIDRSDDQARMLSAGGAIRAGADYIVVGRPIIGAADPRFAAERICEELTLNKN